MKYEEYRMASHFSMIHVLVLGASYRIIPRNKKCSEEDMGNELFFFLNQNPQGMRNLFAAVSRSKKIPSPRWTAFESSNAVHSATERVLNGYIERCLSSFLKALD